jgi:hypothetical protein
MRFLYRISHGAHALAWLPPPSAGAASTQVDRCAGWWRGAGIQLLLLLGVWRARTLHTGNPAQTRIPAHPKDRENNQKTRRGPAEDYIRYINCLLIFTILHKYHCSIRVWAGFPVCGSVRRRNRWGRVCCSVRNQEEVIRRRSKTRLPTCFPAGGSSMHWCMHCIVGLPKIR